MIPTRTLRCYLPGWVGLLCLVFISLSNMTAQAGEGMWSGRTDKFTELVVETQAGTSHIFYVELAEKPSEQAKGLMYRKEMADDAGMIFKFKKQKPLGFWMKNTYIPLDIIFIDQDGVIKSIHENAVPKSLESIHSGVPVIAAFEINGGLSATLGIAVGDVVRHNSLGNLPTQQ